MNTAILLWSILGSALLIIIILLTIIFKLKRLNGGGLAIDDNVTELMNIINDKLKVIDMEIENKVIKNVVVGLGQTKEDLIKQLMVLKETIHQTNNSLLNKNDVVSNTIKQNLMEMDKNITKTISELVNYLNDNTTKLVTDVKNTIQQVNKDFIEQLSIVTEKMGMIDQHLENVEKISNNVQELQKILAPPKQRGNFGEVLLEQLISDLFPKDRYHFQYSIGTDKVDAALEINDKILSIDSKFPMDNYLKYLETNDIKPLMKDVEKMIDDISKKYINPPKTMNFALMYIPSESIWYSLFVMNPSYYKKSIEKRVIPVSPNTLMSFLLLIIEGLRALEIEKDVELILSEINDFNNDIEKSLKEYETLEKHLKNAMNKVGSTKKLLSIVQNKIQSFGQRKKDVENS